MSRAFDAILFDFDGVLVDSEPIHYSCWREILAPYGVDLDWDTYCRVCIGVADRPMVEALCRAVSPPADVERVWSEYPRKKEMFRKRLAATLPFPEATLELLLSLAGRKMAVVSSSGRAEVEPMLEAAGLRALFGAVVCGEDVERHKPAPDPYLLAARLLGVDSALVVEDSVSGIASGRAAGFEVIEVRSPREMAGQVRERLATFSATENPADRLRST